MSELIQKNDVCASRWKLLTGVSALALTAYVLAASIARAEDADRSQLWIELGGQYSQNQNSQEAFLSPFVPASQPPFEIVSPAEVEKPAQASLDGNARITFEPAETEWVLSAAIAFGKTNGNKYLNQLTQNPAYGSRGLLAAYQNITSKNSESHTVLDFQAGRDVGLGIFGSGESSLVSLGLRYVQFNSMSNVAIQSQPTHYVSPLPLHRINASLDGARKFSGVGPSLSWDASAAIAGKRDSDEIAVDWGINASVLFGRQSVRGHHQTTNVFYSGIYPQYTHRAYVPSSRSRQITVPNVGGFAGVSWRYPNAKVSVGHRADFFFGAMDGGIDAAHRENVGFYGPFASVSVGIGG